MKCESKIHLGGLELITRWNTIPSLSYSKSQGEASICIPPILYYFGTVGCWFFPSDTVGIPIQYRSCNISLSPTALNLHRYYIRNLNRCALLTSLNRYSRLTSLNPYSRELATEGRIAIQRRASTNFGLSRGC
jgi:hypothetical protein